MHGAPFAGANGRGVGAVLSRGGGFVPSRRAAAARVRRPAGRFGADWAVLNVFRERYGGVSFAAATNPPRGAAGKTFLYHKNIIYILSYSQRLDYAHELCEARREQLAEDNTTRLVVWIIVLVAVAVACTPSRSDPSRQIRVADPSRRSESPDPSHRSEEPIRVARSESPIRVTDPSHRSESPIRVTVGSTCWYRSEHAGRVEPASRSTVRVEVPSESKHRPPSTGVNAWTGLGLTRTMLEPDRARCRFRRFLDPADAELVRPGRPLREGL